MSATSDKHYYGSPFGLPFFIMKDSFKAAVSLLTGLNLLRIGKYAPGPPKPSQAARDASKAVDKALKEYKESEDSES